MTNANGSDIPVPAGLAVTGGMSRFVGSHITVTGKPRGMAHNTVPIGIVSNPRVPGHHRSRSSETIHRYCCRAKCRQAYAIALTSQVTVCGKAITMTSASPCRAMNGKAPLWMSMTFTSLGATVWR